MTHESTLSVASSSSLQRHLAYNTTANLILRQRLYIVHMLLAFSPLLLPDPEQLIREVHAFGECI